MVFLHFVLVRITLCLIVGIVLSRFCDIRPILWLSGCIILLVIAIVWQRIKPKGRSVGMTMLLGIQAFCLGGWVETSHRQIPADHYIRLLSHEESTARIVLIQRLRTTAKGRRFVAEVTIFDRRPSQGKLLLHLPDAEDHPIGSEFDISGSFATHQSALNPGQFDYGGYLRQKKIYAKCYAKTAKWRGTQNGLWQKADAIRKNLTSTLRVSGFDEKELQVFSALMLGQQQDIDPETIQNYQFAGAVHILSVSGLHVGFVMVLLQFLCKPIPRTRTGSAARLILIIAALWGFALLAGLAPSVVRSATMFSILAIGTHLRRPNNSLHTLVVSLFLLLLIDPAYLFDVGFQLSYAAVGFILWMQPMFNRLWMPPNKIVKYLWSIVTVSLAAQLGTLPLSLYYFHQFPGLFLLTNLVVIPMVGGIMAIGCLTCVAVFLQFAIRPMADLSEWSIRLLNGIMEKIASADSFVFQDIPFHLAAIAAFYLLIGVWLDWYSRPKFSTWKIAATFTILTQCSWLLWRYDAAGEAELTIFRTKSPLIAIRQDRQIDWFGQSDPTVQRDFEGQIYRAKSRQHELPYLLSFDPIKILVVDTLTPLVPNADPDLLLVNSARGLNPERVLKHYKPKITVMGPTTSAWYLNLWNRECRKQKIPFHNIREKGSYTIKKRLFVR